jgi:hypothetical protein
MINPSKYLLYNDPLAGLMDAHFLPGETAKAFSENAVKLEALVDHSVHGYLYETMAKLCRVLELKAELSLDIRNAYKANDREALNKAANEIIPECITRLESFVEAFRRQWYYENKTFLFANQEIRLGGLKERLYSTAARINEYLAGEVEKIEELEQPVLEFKPRDPRKNTYPYFCHNLWEPNAVVGVM